MPIRYTRREFGGRLLPLTPREDEVLTYLQGSDEDNPSDAIIMESEVFGAVNHNRPGHLARQTIRRLRRKLEAGEVTAYTIRVRPGAGYYIDRIED